MTAALLPGIVRLRGGSAVVIRGVRAEDTQALRQFFRDLSPAGRYSRFLRVIRELPEDMLARFTQPDPVSEAVLVASLAHSPDRIIGMAQYAGAGESSEIAVAVADARQRQGLGYQLLDALLKVAAEAGIERIHAEVFADNHGMRQLAQKLGCEIAGSPAGAFLVRATKNLAPIVPVHFDHPLRLATMGPFGTLALGGLQGPSGGQGQRDGERRVSSA